MVDDNLPSVIGVFKDEGKEAFGGAAVFLAAVEVVSADDDREVLIERMDLEIGVAERAHRGSIGIVVLVLVDEAGESTEDLVRDEQSVRRVLVPAREAGKIPLVPGILLGEENLNNVELLTRGGVERVGGLLRGEEDG